MWNDWNNFIQLPCFSPFSALTITFLPLFCFTTACFCYSITQSPHTKKAKCTTHCFALRHTSAFSSQLLPQLSPQHFSNSSCFVRSYGGGSYRMKQETVWNNHHHISKGDRSPVPKSTFKKEPKNNLSVPWWNSDYSQHTVIYQNGRVYCAIIKDESTPWLHSCLQFPARLFHHPCQEWNFPSEGFCLRFTHQFDIHAPLMI